MATTGGESGGKAGLVRVLGPLSAFGVLVGATVGSGVFIVASIVSRALPSPIAALSVWLVAGGLSLLGGLIFSELGAMYPGAGGQYVYLREAFGPAVGFLFGWTMFLVIQTGSIAAVAIASVRFASGVSPIPLAWHAAIATGVILVLTGVNLLDIRKGARFLDSLTALKILALAGVALAGLLHPAKEAIPVSWVGTRAPAYGVALIAVFWAYEGWSYLSFLAGEVKDPQRNIPLATASGIAAVVLFYFGANLAYYRLLPVSAIVASPMPAADAARLIGGDWALRAFSLVMTISALACNNAVILSAARVTYALAADGGLPPALAYVHPDNRVPSAALLAQAAWTIVLVWSGRYDQLIAYVVCASLIFYTLTAAAVIALRHSRPQAPRPYRAPLYPWLPIAYILATAAIVVNSFREKPAESLAGLGIVLLGLPVYFWIRRAGPEAVGAHSSEGAKTGLAGAAGAFDAQAGRGTPRA